MRLAKLRMMEYSEDDQKATPRAEPAYLNPSHIVDVWFDDEDGRWNITTSETHEEDWCLNMPIEEAIAEINAALVGKNIF